MNINKKSIIFELSLWNFVKKTPPHLLVILTKFHDDSWKIVDFFQLVKFWSCSFFYGPVSRSLVNKLSGRREEERGAKNSKICKEKICKNSLTLVVMSRENLEIFRQAKNLVPNWIVQHVWISFLKISSTTTSYHNSITYE